MIMKFVYVSQKLRVTREIHRISFSLVKKYSYFHINFNFSALLPLSLRSLSTDDLSFIDQDRTKI